MPLLKCRKLNKIILLLALGASLPSCVTSLEREVDLNRPPEDDKEYFPALRKATRAADVVSNFETHWTITTTHLSPEFLTAFNRRLERVYLQGSSSFEDAKAKTGFFVSIYSPENDVTDLSNPNHWTIVLEKKDGQLRPVLVKKLSDKIRWRSFFDTVGRWTEEYLVVFDTPAINPDANLVEKAPINLIFANANARITFTW